MPFTFTDYTYSGLLSFVTILFSFAYPKIIDCISEIDKKYNSTLLTARFRREPILKLFSALLIANIIVAVLVPFLMYGCDRTYVWIIVQAVCTVLLIAVTFCLFHTIQHYYDSIDLHQTIWNKYTSLLANKRDRVDEERNFNAWVDLSKVILTSSDQKAARRVYEHWTEYVAKFYKDHKNDNQDYDQYFYDGLTRLNETLCKMPTIPNSVNNGNDIITSLILLDKCVTKSTYIMLWKNLRIQLFYNMDEWIMSYWTQASQKYNLFMRKVTTFDRNEDTGEHYTEEEVSIRDKERWEFLRFHIMLCAMIMKMEKYSLLSRMLSFTQSIPPSYPIVPSSVSDICSAFLNITNDDDKNPFLFESYYPMPGFSGISNGKILSASFEFLSLLLFRVYTLQLPLGSRMAMHKPVLQDTLGDLRSQKQSIDTLQYWVKKTKLNKKLLEVVGISNWEETLQRAQVNYGVEMEDPEFVINTILGEIDHQADDIRKNDPLSEKIVNDVLKSISQLLKKGLNYYNSFLGKRDFSNVVSYWVNGAMYSLYPNTAFLENPDISFALIEEATSEHIIRSFDHYFGSTFARTPCSAYYNIDAQDVFHCLEKLNIGKEQIVVSFNIYWDYYLEREQGLTKITNEGNKYKYKEIEILDLPINTPLVARKFYVLNKEEMPWLEFTDPDEDQIKKYKLKSFEDSYKIWLSVQKISDNPEILSESERKNMSDDPNEQSMLSASLIAKCHWKKTVDMVEVQVKQKMFDNGNIDNVDIVKPFNATNHS